MGAGKISTAVTDAGPLIHLTEIGRFRFLRVFDSLYIPDAVWSETVEQSRIPQSEILTLGTVQRYTVPPLQVVQFIQENGLEGLHAGERECLWLCRQIGVSILLTDDLAVREACKNLNLTPVGSVGIVARAYRLRHFSLIEVERYITDLYEVSSLFVSRAIVELAIEQLRKHPDQS